MEPKIKIPASFKEFEFPKRNNVKFVPVNNISPTHNMVKNWVFPFDEEYVSEELPTDEAEASYIEANLEANLADAMARVAELNGVSVNELQHLFPAVLRMLKSESGWSQ